MKFVLVAIAIGICFREISANFLRFATLDPVTRDLEQNFEPNFTSDDLKEKSIVVVSLAGIKNATDPLLINILTYLSKHVSDRFTFKILYDINNNK